MALRNWITDWRRRRRAVRSYLRSRKYKSGVAGENNAAPEECASRPARALEKLPTRGARVRRIAVWRRLRPVIRWHRRARVGVVLGVYFGSLGLLSLLLSTYFLLPSPPPKEDVPLAEGTGLVAMTLEATARNALRDQPPGPDDIATLQQEAETAFRSGDYATAEKLFRRLLPKVRLKALAGFHIYLCLLQQGKSAELEVLSGKIPSKAVAKNPLPLYAKAASALKAGRPAEAGEQIASARRQFPDISPFYDKALREAGLPPPAP